MEVTKWSGSTLVSKGRLGRFSDHAGRNASEGRAGLETGNTEADPPVNRGRPLAGWGSERRGHRSASVGVLAPARMEGEGGLHESL